MNNLVSQDDEKIDFLKSFPVLRRKNNRSISIEEERKEQAKQLATKQMHGEAKYNEYTNKRMCFIVANKDVKLYEELYYKRNASEVIELIALQSSI